MGKPAATAFQRAVRQAGLDLLTRPSGPVLEDHPVDLSDPGESAVPACPVSFAPAGVDTANWTQRLLTELASLQPWHDLDLHRRNQRRLTGVSGRGPGDNVWIQTWQRHDLIIRDNRRARHRRDGFAPDSRRLMKRCQVLGRR